MSAPSVKRGPLERVVVLIPTYNERGNVERIVTRVRAAVPAADVLVLDDNSPDGTGQVADALAGADPHVHVLHRREKAGLGAAYLAGFAWAIERGYDAAVEMDADGSHRPEQLPALLHAARDADLVIGSRWVRGGSVVNWPVHRKLLSVGANLYTKYLLGIPVNDATAGYRVYRTAVLAALDLSGVHSRGYGFQVDMTWALTRAGCVIVEVPIQFVEREVGESKMSRDIIVEALRNVTRKGVQHRARQLRTAAARVAERRREGQWHSA